MTLPWRSGPQPPSRRVSICAMRFYDLQGMCRKYSTISRGTNVNGGNCNSLECESRRRSAQHSLATGPPAKIMVHLLQGTDQLDFYLAGTVRISATRSRNCESLVVDQHMFILDTVDCTTPVGLPQAAMAQELELCFNGHWALLMAGTKHYFAFRSGAFCCI